MSLSITCDCCGKGIYSNLILKAIPNHDHETSANYITSLPDYGTIIHNISVEYGIDGFLGSYHINFCSRECFEKWVQKQNFHLEVKNN